MRTDRVYERRIRPASGDLQRLDHRGDVIGELDARAQRRETRLVRSARDALARQVDLVDRIEGYGHLDLDLLVAAKRHQLRLHQVAARENARRLAAGGPPRRPPGKRRRPGVHHDPRIAQADAEAQHLARRLRKDDLLAHARLGDFGDHLARGFGRQRGVADLRQLLGALHQHQMAELLGDVFERDALQGSGKLLPPARRNRPVQLGGGRGAQAHHAEPAVRQSLLAHHFRRVCAGRRNPVVLHPQRVPALVGPLRAQHAQMRPGEHDRLARERKHHAALVVVVADIALVHFARTKAADEKAAQTALAHQRPHGRPAPVALGERQDRRRGPSFPRHLRDLCAS